MQKFNIKNACYRDLIFMSLQVKNTIIARFIYKSRLKPAFGEQYK